MLIWYLKQLKDFILKFSINESFFLQKALFLLILASFPSGVCVDEVVNNWANYHGYKDNVYLL